MTSQVKVVQCCILEASLHICDFPHTCHAFTMWCNHATPTTVDATVSTSCVKWDAGHVIICRIFVVSSVFTGQNNNNNMYHRVYIIIIIMRSVLIVFRFTRISRKCR